MHAVRYALDLIASHARKHFPKRGIRFLDHFIDVVFEKFDVFDHVHEFHDEDFALLFQEIVAVFGHGKLLFHGEEIRFCRRNIQFCHRLVPLRISAFVFAFRHIFFDVFRFDAIELFARQRR